MPKGVVAVRLTEEQTAWVAAEAVGRKTSASEIIRDCVEHERTRKSNFVPTSELQDEKPHRPPPSRPGGFRGPKPPSREVQTFPKSGAKK